MKTSWKWGLAVGAGLTLPILAFVVALGIPSGNFGLRRTAAEAKLNVRLLCRQVVRYREQQGEWLAAGPEPKTIPAQPVRFVANPEFQKLGFDPGEVRYQYQVEVAKDGDQVKTVRCIARGDLDGDGVQSQFFIYLNSANKEIGQLETVEELE